MLKISKLTDYSTVVMAYLAQFPEKMHNAKDITAQTHIALPTVSKILKALTKSGLLLSHRGAHGGYSLANEAIKITIADIITAMEGKPGLTECSHNNTLCALQPTCAISGNWQTISSIVYKTLEKISLQDMVLLKGSHLQHHFNGEEHIK
jgi:FeS assembly SUF system regulator